MKFILKNKNIYFQIIVSMRVTLHDIFLPFILFNQFYACLFLLSFD